LKKYNIILADPPWRYENRGARGALGVIRAWGFAYKGMAFVWVKQNKKGKGWHFGLGFWTRGNAELCLLAGRGKPKRQSIDVSQLVISPLRGHSKKSDEVKERIVQLAGDLPRIELFARTKMAGWDVWGNEVESDIELTGCVSGGGADVG